MSDKKISIGIETTANTSGAEKAGRSIDQLEAEVRQLQRELAQLPTGSEQFAVMAKRLGDAQSQLGKATAAAEKLGATVGNKGNAGMAVLEFSRAFEDAQYGMRGVLNNLPGLIAMLGGGAGLAGVISIAAVAGTYLWEKFGQGTKEAEKETEDLLATFGKLVKVYQEFEDAQKEDREQALEDQASRLKGQLDSNAFRFKLDVDAGAVEAARGKAAAMVQLAKDRLELTRVEAALVIATGEKAVKLAKDREAIIAKIHQDELAITEELRKQALKAAESKVNKAQSDVDAKAADDNSLSQQASALRSAIEALLANADELATSRAFAAGQARDEQDALRELIETLQQDIKDHPTFQGEDGQGDDRTSKINDAIQKIDELQKIISDTGTMDEEMNLRAEAKAMQNTLDDLNPKLKDSAKAQKDAAKAMTDATLELKSLRQNQSIERGNEKDLRNIDDLSSLEQQKGSAGQQTADDITRLLGLILAALPKGGAEDPGNNKLVSDVKALAADGIQAGEQDEVLRLVGTLVKQIKGTGEDQAKLWKSIMEAVEDSVRVQKGFQGKIDDIKRDIVTIQQNLKR